MFIRFQKDNMLLENKANDGISRLIILQFQDFHVFRASYTTECNVKFTSINNRFL